MKRIAPGFVALVSGMLLFNAFIANDLDRQSSANRLIVMLTDLYGGLLGTIRAAPTEIVFAVCTVGIVALVFRDGRKAQ